MASTTIRMIKGPEGLNHVDYSDEERIFMLAVQKYKEDNRRPYPTHTEILAILKSLGYERVNEPSPMPVFHRGSGHIPRANRGTQSP